MPGPPLLIDRPGPRVARLRLNRPERRNAVDLALVHALLDAFAATDDVGAIVLSSADPAGFCAGADVGIPDEERREVSERLYELYERMLATPVPIIAAIAGAAVGGGAQLAVASDIRLVGPAARLRFAGPGHGLAVGAWALPSLVGRGRAVELCLTMRWVDAGEAVRIGLAEELADDVEAAALALAETVARADRGAAARVKALVGRAGGHAAVLGEEAAGNRGWAGSLESPAGP